uniref:Aminotransferase class I/classII domain-containing protein n=1 Tax=Panagrolaimus sp. ES5 TaxID=591445 RepID=A0AC34GVA0_9BILA
MNEIMCSDIKNPIKAEKILVISGATMICDLLSHVLFDEGGILFAHSPFYHRFLNDFIDRGLIDIVSIPTMFEGSNKAERKVELYQQAFQKAISKRKSVNAILIVNPRNPDGGYWLLSELKHVIDWAVKENNLYVILDEIYDLSVYDPIEGKPFESAIRIFDQDPTLDRNRLIWMSGLSKNFSLPGLRTAAMYTPNAEVLAATRRFLMLQGPNATTEFIAREILGYLDRIKNVFLKENLKQLRKCRDKTIAWLEEVKRETKKDIKWIQPRAGFFILIDFSCISLKYQLQIFALIQ